MPQDRRPEKARRILYVDDNTHDRVLVRDALDRAQYPYELIEASTFEEFKQLLEQGQPDLILTDFNILGVDAFDILDLVREKMPETPVVIVTGTGSEAAAVKALRRGVNDYVIKTPQHIRHLPHTLEGVFNKAHAESAQRKAERAAAENAERYKHIADNTLDCIWSADLAMNFTYTNPAVKTMLGYTPEEFVKLNLSDLADEEHLAQMWDIIEDRLKKPPEESGIVFETVIHDKQGRPVDVEIHGCVLYDENDNPQGLHGVTRDIRERHELEKQLRQSQKLEAIGTLAGGVAHEINNPIMGIMNYAEIIRDLSRDKEEKIEMYAGEIIHETERVASLVRNLLAFARQEKQEHSPARICDIIEGTLSLVRAVLRNEQILMSIDVPEDLPKTKCRSQQLQQVIMNLVTNARDALNEKYPTANDNKRIVITSALFEKDGKPWIRTTVEDHGMGIPDKVRERLFDPFFTTKPRHKGTGLGLAICHGIVKDHHGTLSVESEPGEWTRVHIDIPVDNGWAL